MELFNDFLLTETHSRAHKEVLYAIRSVNDIYHEWKRRGTRRKNAMNIVSTSVNKIRTFSPESIDFVNDNMKQKLAIIIMRCMTIPCWKPLITHKLVYKKLYPYIKKLENIDPNTGTNGTLREIIMTRLSAAVSHQSHNPRVFVGYEPLIPNEYLKFLFLERDMPLKTYRMETLPLPEDFEDLIEILEINQRKAIRLNKKKLKNK